MNIKSVIKNLMKKFIPMQLYCKILTIYDILYDNSVGTIRRYKVRKIFNKKKQLAPYKPRIGLHTVFIAKENILFLEEWILYHKSIGIDYFFLYDNSKVEVIDAGYLDAGAVVGETAKRGIPYNKIVDMSNIEIQEELDRIQTQIENIYIYEWSPVDDDGHIWFGQSECQNHAAHTHKDMVDWMLFMDIDEYLVSKQNISDICINALVNGNIGIEFWQCNMDNRYHHLDKLVCDIDLKCNAYHPYAFGREFVGKVMCYLPLIRSVSNHRFDPFVPRVKYYYDDLYYRHYKCNHSIKDYVYIEPLNVSINKSPPRKLDNVIYNWHATMHTLREQHE